MKKDFIEWNGKNYPVRFVMLPENEGGYEVMVADYELWAAIESEYEKGNPAAKGIDNDIFFYCNSGFIASDPTDAEIIALLSESI